jgi:Family of unknown function (DUF5343)
MLTRPWLPTRFHTPPPQPGLKAILAGVPGWGTTNKIDGKWLAGVGFRGGTAAQSLSVLRAVGIVGSNGEPTALWIALRTKDRAAFAAGIRKHYADLFATFQMRIARTPRRYSASCGPRQATERTRRSALNGIPGEAAGVQFPPRSAQRRAGV